MDVVSNRLNPQSSLVVQALIRDSQLFSKASIFRLTGNISKLLFI